MLFQNLALTMTSYQICPNHCASEDWAVLHLITNNRQFSHQQKASESTLSAAHLIQSQTNHAMDKLKDMLLVQLISSTQSLHRVLITPQVVSQQE